MENRELMDLASTRANEYAPAPKNGASMAGIVGASTTAIILISLAGFYFLDLRDYWFVVSLILAAAFAVPFASSRLRSRRHDQAYARELQRGDERED